MFIPLEGDAITYLSSAQVPSQIDFAIGPQHLEDLSFESKVTNFKPSDHYASTSLELRERPKQVVMQKRFFTKKFNQEKTKEV